MQNECKICKSESKVFKVDLPFFRHLDFKTISSNGNLYECINCGMIINTSATERQKVFKEKAYSNSSQTSQLFYFDEFQEPVTRSFLQAKLIKDKILKNDNYKILDIGCFDGKLLLELSKIYRKSTHFYGFDINKNLNFFFPSKANFHFEFNDLNDIREKFDLIILSHSIYYFSDLRDLLRSVSSLLNEEGVLFIQLTNNNLNFCNFLLGDCTNIFYKSSIISILDYSGFRAEFMENKFLSRDVLLKCRRKKYNENYENKLKIENNFQIQKVLSNTSSLNLENSINSVENLIERLKNINLPNLVVIGTTLNAAFVDEILQDNIKFFVDENINNAGKKFRGKEINHPRNLEDFHNIIVPFGEKSAGIQRRFKSLYKGNYINC